MNTATKIPTKNLKNYLAALLLAVSLVSCNPTKKLLPNQFMVDKVEVKNNRETNIPKENFENFFRQKPNRKIFSGVEKLNRKLLNGIDFYVWWYNLFDNEKIARKRETRNLKYDQKNTKKSLHVEKKNERRAKKGKKPKTPRLKDKESPLFLESLRDMGEPAVIFDSLLMEQTRLQLSRYLFSKGFFNNSVKNTVQLHKKRAKINYILYPKKPYIIHKIFYRLEDEELGKLILQDTVNSLLKRGMQYDEEKLQAERQRITDKALNNGYYYFENAYISFSVDSAFNNSSVSVEVRLAKFSKQYSSGNDSLVKVNHPKFKIENVYIITEQTLGNIRDAHFSDTSSTRREGTVFLLNDDMAFKKRLLLRNIDIYRGQLFRRDTAQQTYKQLSGLGVFRNVTIQFFENDTYKDNRLDCYIVCNPLKKQQFGMEVQGTNTSGNLGIDGNVLYQNKNSFKGGELLEFRIRGALIAQRQLSQDSNYIKRLNDIADFRKLQETFSTIQFGPELRFSVPRAIFPFSLFPFRKDQQPRTYVKTSLNYQTSPVFSRVIADIEYGFTFKALNGRLKHELIPFEAYLVRARLVPSYEEFITDQNDAFLLNSFQDHITILSKYGVSFTSKENSVHGSHPAYFVKLNMQSAGSGLREAYKLAGIQPDTLGHYLLFNIPFAQFIKVDTDLRVYIPFGKKSRWVYRVAGGIGRPLKNLGVLPYEQSFFSGGPNSVRAWRARTLGPGGYTPLGTIQTRYDKIGDILLEGNAEFRFHIFKAFNGALFVDAGNIWRLYPDENKPNGEFLVSNFINEIAIGGGFGLRWDLDFFVLRLDLAVPLKDPKLPVGQRWTFDRKPWNYTVFNFGIGYPF
ncbi:MAG: BamA/TamA family outer membrane protein [Bacteroidetes bacterium]|nr:BamA/TamA family outer membrane protein [Bacteroidota bacterium]